MKNNINHLQIIANTRILEYYDGTIEVIRFVPGWIRYRGSNNRRVQNKCKSRKSINYEQNRFQTLKKAKTKVKRLIRQYGFRYLYTIRFGNDSLSIENGDRRIGKLRQELKNSCSSFKDYILTRAYENNLLYYKLLTDVFISQQINSIWEHGSVSFKGYGYHFDELLGDFTSSFEDKRFEGYHSYIPGKATKLVINEEYFNSLSETKNFISNRYPGKKKIYERDYQNGRVTNLFYK